MHWSCRKYCRTCRFSRAGGSATCSYVWTWHRNQVREYWISTVSATQSNVTCLYVVLRICRATLIYKRWILREDGVSFMRWWQRVSRWISSYLAILSGYRIGSLSAYKPHLTSDALFPRFCAWRRRVKSLCALRMDLASAEQHRLNQSYSALCDICITCFL